MSVEAPPRPSGLNGAEVLPPGPQGIDQVRAGLELGPEADPAQISRTLRAEIVPGINTAMNEAISQERAADRARARLNPLFGAENDLDISDELRRHEAGEGSALSESAQAALDAGMTSTSLMERAFTRLGEHRVVQAEQAEQLEFDKKLGVAREGYVDVLMKRPRLRGRKTHAEQLTHAEQTYNEAFTGKLRRLMELDPGHDKMPYPQGLASELAEQPATAEHLAGGQLHMLVDQLSREQLLKAQAIETRSNRGGKRVAAAFKKSRALRVVVGGAIWAGGVAAANTGMLPEGMQFLGEGADKILPLVAGYVTSREVANGVGEGLEKFSRSRRLKRDINVLTADSFTTELALRTVYSNLEYQEGQIATRTGGETQNQNKEAVGNIGSEFAKLEQEGARGGKPYKAEDVMRHVTDLYVHRKDQIDQVLTSEDPKEAFLGLASEVIAADTRQLSEQQKASRAKKAASRALAVVSSVFANQWLGQVDNLSSTVSRTPSMAAVA